MITGDASYIKKINRSIILKEIVKEGLISRADLSKITALTKATISAQVAELLEDELLVEKHLEHNAVGRKPIMLSLNAQAGYTLGIDLDFGQITFMMTDLSGRPIVSSIVHTDTVDYSAIVALLIKHISEYREKYADSRYGIVGIVISIHGLVSSEEVIHYIPKLGWTNVHFKNDLEQALGVPIQIENNANLSSFAESVFIHHDTDNLLSVTLYSGIGLGMIINNQFFRGHDGFAGEIGHMIVVPEGRSCECGNRGCWEKYAAEASVFEELADKKHLPHPTFEHIQQWINQGDKEVYEVMERFLYYLTIGLNNIINIYNPEVIVLNSELLRLYPDSLSKIKHNLNSRISHYRELSISTIGEKSSVLGACALAIEHFLDVPILNLSYNGDAE